MILELRKKSQITIPKEIVDVLGLREGDKLEVIERDGVIQLIPVVVYPKKYIDELRRDITEAKDSGKIFDNVAHMFEELNRN